MGGDDNNNDDGDNGNNGGGGGGNNGDGGNNPDNAGNEGGHDDDDHNMEDNAQGDDNDDDMGGGDDDHDHHAPGENNDDSDHDDQHRPSHRRQLDEDTDMWVDGYDSTNVHAVHRGSMIVGDVSVPLMHEDSSPEEPPTKVSCISLPPRPSLQLELPFNPAIARSRVLDLPFQVGSLPPLPQRKPRTPPVAVAHSSRQDPSPSEPREQSKSPIHMHERTRSHAERMARGRELRASKENLPSTLRSSGEPDNKKKPSNKPRSKGRTKK